jgi:hypothetical protein
VQLADPAVFLFVFVVGLPTKTFAFVRCVVVLFAATSVSVVAQIYIVIIVHTQVELLQAGEVIENLLDALPVYVRGIQDEIPELLPLQIPVDFHVLQWRVQLIETQIDKFQTRHLLEDSEDLQLLVFNGQVDKNRFLTSGQSFSLFLARSSSSTQAHLATKASFSPAVAMSQSLRTNSEGTIVRGDLQGTKIATEIPSSSEPSDSVELSPYFCSSASSREGIFELQQICN